MRPEKSGNGEEVGRQFGELVAGQIEIRQIREKIEVARFNGGDLLDGKV